MLELIIFGVLNVRTIPGFCSVLRPVVLEFWFFCAGIAWEGLNDSYIDLIPAWIISLIPQCDSKLNKLSV